MENNYLQHWGILGMKWGVRRYQNKDGTLTSAGKKRYSEGSQTNESRDSLEAKYLKTKKLSELSNEELRVLTKRQNLEASYKKLNPGSIAKGAAYITSAVAITGGAISLYNNGSKIVDIGKKYFASKAKNTAKEAAKNAAKTAAKEAAKKTTETTAKNTTKFLLNSGYRYK